MDQICSASSAPTGLIVQVCFPGARAAVLDNLNRQREEGRLCDLAIQVQGHVFRAHRCVLAASSPYFHDQVLLKNVTMVSLPSVMDPVAFESVLSSAYTGQLSIVHEDIVNYVTVASFLQMWHIVDKCTELLKRHRPPVDVNPVGELASTQPGTSSRQQSPSSSDCLYVEREARRKDRKPDALPPLATWRRPQQFPKWGRAKPASAPHSADSQLGCGESEFPGCEEVWLSSGAKESHDGHSGPHPVEAARQRARFNQRGAAVAPAMERVEKSRAGLEMGDAQEKRRDEKGGMEADEGIGEEVAEKRERSSQPGHTGAAHTQADGGGGGGPAEARGGAADAKERDPSETSPMVRAGGLGSHHGAVDPPSPSLVPSPRTQWQASPWSQAELRPQDSAGYRKEEDEVAAAVDFEHLSDGHFVGKTYDEIEDGTGQVSQRPLATPGSPDHGEFTAAAAGATWSLSNPGQGGGGGGGGGGRHSSPSSAPFPPCPSSSPPTPSSSSSLTLAGAPYTGKVHFCHCGKAYTLKSMRDRHVKMQHLNLRPFGCPVCAKSFKMKHHLTKHLKTHGGLRPYECGLCGKKVIWRESFLRHQARCERLAAGGVGVGGALLAAEDPENSYGYGFDHGEALLALAGQVKVEEVDCVSGIMDELRTQSGNLRGQAFKEEASEAFS